MFRTPSFAKEAERWSYGITSDQWSLRAEDFKNIYCTVPPLEEQQAIARFLDHQDRRINRFIRNKRRLIELLNEQKQAIVHQAVTRGLDPKVPLKPSGIDWLGDVPAHWGVRKLNQVARLESGHTPSRNNPEYWQNCIIPWVSLKDVGKLRDATLEFIEDTEEKISELGLANSSARLLPAGTVILSRTASVGFSAILGRPMATTQDFVNWICSPSIEPRYLLQCLRAMRGKLGQLVMGSTHKTIYMPDLRSFVVPIPPLHEQMTIIDLVARDSAAIVGAVDRAKREIDLMREYRNRLIADVVTGKLDVRGLIDEGEVDAPDGRAAFEEEVVFAEEAVSADGADEVLTEPEEALIEA